VLKYPPAAFVCLYRSCQGESLAQTEARGVPLPMLAPSVPFASTLSVLFVSSPSGHGIWDHSMNLGSAADLKPLPWLLCL
jgi:hypothetical protein